MMGVAGREAMKRKRTKLTTRQSAKVANNYGLVFAAVTRFGGRFTLDRDDANQEAALALLSAVRGFKRSRGCALSTYAYKAIENRLTFVARREQRRCDRAANGLAAEVAATMPAEIQERAEPVDLSALDARERTIIQSRFGIGGRRRETLDALGGHFNVTKERVRQIQGRTLGKLRRGIQAAESAGRSTTGATRSEIRPTRAG
jgi:RNA polymerase sigma factor (sigma-70 family)